MDWLSQYKENIDYKKKNIMMVTEDNVKVNYQGQRQEKKFLSILKAKKLLRRGCEAYLEHVVDIEKEIPDLNKIPVVREFPDVFPEELPGFPPDREIEFSIDLVPEAEPVLKAPYCMAPVEMKEHAKQLQELLDKGVIRPSVSPWGKANVVADALSRTERLNAIKVSEELVKELEKLEIEIRMQVENKGQLYEITFQLELMDKIKKSQEEIMNHELDSLTGEKLCTQKDNKGENKLLGPELVQQTKDAIVLIRKRLEAAQDRQKKNANLYRKDMDIEIGSLVLLTVSPWKGLDRFGQKGKLSPRYIGPFEVLRKVGKVAYELALPPQLQHFHNVFHVSILKRYIPDSNQVIEYEPIKLQPDLSYVERPIQILDRKEQVLRNKSIPIVKVL
ncbi:uncharacterized protein LOC141706431 [Apium graveolens]|uniref:uncharacterized protein LOC141706431 n=1 Tax=Apium graveolens TaxID=4045 RepID=UPI003D7AFEF1